MTFKVPEADILIKVDPSLLAQQYQTEEEEERYLINSQEKPAIVKKSVITCRFPPTDRLSIQWTENMGTNVKVRKIKEILQHFNVFMISLKFYGVKNI